MPKSIEFPKAAPQWIPNRDSVRFFALVDGRVTECLISLEALMDHFGIGERDPDEAVRVYQTHRSDIEQAARLKIEADRSGRLDQVMLKTKDFPKLSESARSPRVRALKIKASPEVQHHPGLSRDIDEASSILEDRFVRVGMDVTAEWDLVASSGQPLVQLTLVDGGTNASVNHLFTRAELGTLTFNRNPFFGIWTDLQSSRYERLSQALEANAELAE